MRSGVQVMMVASFVAAAAVTLGAGFGTTPAGAHSSGCHTSYSCPSDHHSYTWYDESGAGWSCARPGSDKYNPAWDTTLITYAGLPYHCHLAGSSPPPPPTPLPTPAVPEDPVPVEPEPEEPKPAPLPVYMGNFGFAYFAMPSATRPPRLHPFSADNGAYFYGLRWSDWGEPKARARGKATVNTCDPYCAAGKYVRRRGAKAVAYRLQKGDCNGEPARFYTRALMRFPKAYGIKAMTLKLKTGCI